MSKWFEVKVTTVNVYAVKLGDEATEEDAMRTVSEEVDDFDEMECKPVEGEISIDRLKRHAYEVINFA